MLVRSDEDFTGKEKKPYEYRDKRCWYRAELTKILGFYYCQHVIYLLIAE